MPEDKPEVLVVSTSQEERGKKPSAMLDEVGLYRLLQLMHTCQFGLNSQNVLVKSIFIGYNKPNTQSLKSDRL